MEYFLESLVGSVLFYSQVSIRHFLGGLVSKKGKQPFFRKFIVPFSCVIRRTVQGTLFIEVERHGRAPSIADSDEMSRRAHCVGLDGGRHNGYDKVRLLDHLAYQSRGCPRLIPYRYFGDRGGVARIIADGDLLENISPGFIRIASNREEQEKDDSGTVYGHLIFRC